MSQVMDEEIKRWTARRNSALALEIIQARTTVGEAALQFDLTPTEVEDRIDQGKVGLENALRTASCYSNCGGTSVAGRNFFLATDFGY